MGMTAASADRTDEDHNADDEDDDCTERQRAPTAATSASLLKEGLRLFDCALARLRLDDSHQRTRRAEAIELL